MAEPTGILIEARIGEARLAAFFKHKIPYRDGAARIGHVLSEILDRGDSPGDILILNHDPQQETLFLVWILNHYSAEAAAPMWPIVDALADHMDTAASAEGALASTLPECLESLRIENGSLIRGESRRVSRPTLQRLSGRLWSFATKDTFPSAALSMRLPDYQCKAFKAAWKKYLKWRDEQDRPNRIAAATGACPYRLFNDVFCWGDKVVKRDDYTSRDILFPGADPLSFRMEAGFHADKNHVWQRRLAQNSPPARIALGDRAINNPAAIWEYCIVPDAVGSDFTWFDSRWDTAFWTDKRRIYALGDQGLAPLPGIRAEEFRQFGQCFGTDGHAVFCGEQPLPLNATRLQTQSYFIWDDEKVFMTTTELPLRARSFRILGQKHVAGVGGGLHFRLADGERTIILAPNKICLPDDPLF